MAAKNIAICSREVTKSFGEAAARTVAVNQVSFDAPFGEMSFIVGPSGSGKTTLLSIISGILRPDAGQVLVAGSDIWALGEDELATFRLQRIGFVFQDYHLFANLTTLENVAVPLLLGRVEWSEAMQRARGFLEVVGLASRASLNPTRLSGGEQQRVAIARALAKAPDIMIFDEPTASLDGDTGRKIIEFVKREVLNPKRCIVVVTHDDRIYEFADHLLHMEDGYLRESGGRDAH